MSEPERSFPMIRSPISAPLKLRRFGLLARAGMTEEALSFSVIARPVLIRKTALMSWEAEALIFLAGVATLLLVVWAARTDKTSHRRKR